MNSRIACVTAALLVALLADHRAHAHHSFAMFDNTKQIKLTGTVSSFDWTNPHVYFALDVPEDGKTTKWTIECANIGILKRAGWNLHTLAVGDKVSAVIAPLHSGDKGGLLKEVATPDGHRYNNGPYAGTATIPE